MKRTLMLGIILAFPVVMAEVGVEKDIPYAVHGRCKLDVKWPLNVTNFSTVVWFHGGGLTEGGKHFVRIDESIAQVAVNYRLLERDKMEDGEVCIHDAAAAVAWTIEHISKYGGDPKRVFVSGMSAGGYLTMMVGMSPKYLKEHGHDLTELAGIAPISGQATKHYNVRSFLGDKDSQLLPKIDELAPLHWCSTNIPPIVAICGQEPWEWKCRSEENRLLISSCVALGHRKAWFVSCPYADHGRAYIAGVPYVEMFIKGLLPCSQWVSTSKEGGNK
ncbi:MAG: alpha/beta hydrolase [Kiritimatiellae bacterium]|nr:alpha/beta hydrolase [Kiritimatiellia bacterium]